MKSTHTLLRFADIASNAVNVAVIASYKRTLKGEWYNTVSAINLHGERASATFSTFPAFTTHFRRVFYGRYL